MELKGVPYTSTVDGSKLGTANTILKKLAHVKGMRTCTAELLTFPVAANKAEIGILYTKNQVTYRGVMPMAPAIPSKSDRKNIRKIHPDDKTNFQLYYSRLGRERHRRG